MQIEELLQLSEWFKKYVEKNQIPQNYTKLYNKMNANIRRQGMTQNQPFIDEKNNLFKALNKVDYKELTFEQIKFLENLEVDKILNKEGIIIINDALNSNKLDIVGATNIIKGYHDKVVNAQSKLNEINNLLSPYFSSIDKNEIHNDEVLMRLYFQEGAAINNIADLKKLSANWYDISRGIAMAMGETPEVFRVIGAKKGSIIIELAIMAMSAKLISQIILEALKVAERVLDIKKKAEEIKALELSNKKIEIELAKEGDQEREKGLSSIIKSTIEHLKLDKDTEGDKITAIEKSVKKLLDFTESGGQVDFVQNENIIDENVRNENVLLKENVKEIRKILYNIKNLE